MDNAVRRLEGKRTSLGRRKKARGSTNAHSGKASDLSGTTLGPLATSFLRRKVATLFRGLRPEKVAPAGQLAVNGCGSRRARLRSVSMSDQLSTLYDDFLKGSYDCVDRVILNAYFTMGQSGGGLRTWWRALYGSDNNLDDNHLMRMAGRFSRRLRAWAKENEIPVVYSSPGERKHDIASEHLATHKLKPGLFMILVSKAPALVWEAQRTGTGKLGPLVPKQPWPYVNHYSFHILDKDWGHLTIKMSGHPPFGAQVMLNGHEYVARQRKKPTSTSTNRTTASRRWPTPRNLRKSQTPCLETRLQGAYCRSVIVGFIPPASVLLSTWKNRTKVLFAIS